MLSAITSLLGVTCLLSFQATAHFILQYPPSLGFDDDTESTAPCGGFTVSFNSSDASVPIGGFPISMLSTHPAADWLFRATLDQQAPFNWTNLLPVVSEVGLGQFCIPDFQTPSDFSGKSGVLQVIQHGPDGILYQVCFPIILGCSNQWPSHQTFHRMLICFSLSYTRLTTPLSSVLRSTSSLASTPPSAPAARMLLA